MFSTDVDDEVYATFRFPDGATGQLAANWSDESFRKMSMQITIWGTNGRMRIDRQEIQIYLKGRSELIRRIPARLEYALHNRIDGACLVLSARRRIFDANRSFRALHQRSKSAPGFYRLKQRCRPTSCSAR